MRKTLILSIIIISLGALFWFVHSMLAIVTGYTAKNMCSCVFVAGIPEETVHEVDFNFSVLSLAKVEVDREEKKVRSTVWGMQPKTAIYRDYIGCSLAGKDGGAVYTYSGFWTAPQNDSIVSMIMPDSTVGEYPGVQKILEAAFLEEGEEKKRNTRATVVLYKGKMIAEAYADGFDETSRLLGWSMTKSLTASMFGKLMQQGKVSLDDPVAVEEWQADERKNITWRNLLNMAPGLDWVENYSIPSDVSYMLYDEDNMGAFAGSAPLRYEPGSFWEYSSGTSNIVSYNLAGFFPDVASYQRFLYDEIFYKIGANSMVIEADASGYFVGSSYSWATARDWARIGQLYLQEGEWNGEQLLPRDWIEFAHTPISISDNAYGGHFWLNANGGMVDVPENVYMMSGFHGQRVFIIPDEDLVIVRLGVTYKQSDFNFNEFVSSIIREVRESS